MSEYQKKNYWYTKNLGFSCGERGAKFILLNRKFNKKSCVTITTKIILHDMEIAFITNVFILYLMGGKPLVLKETSGKLRSEI